MRLLTLALSLAAAASASPTAAESHPTAERNAYSRHFKARLQAQVRFFAIHRPARFLPLTRSRLPLPTLSSSTRSTTCSTT